MNNKHLAIVTGLTALATAADQFAGTGVLSAFGPWGAAGSLFLAALANAYLHRNDAANQPPQKQ